MNIGKSIKTIRENRGMSQKEVISIINMEAAQYSRIETGKTEPSISTLERITKALGISVIDLLSFEKNEEDIKSYDTTVMEKVKLVEGLTEEEKKTMYIMLDAFIKKRKLKNTLKDVLKNIDE